MSRPAFSRVEPTTWTAFGDTLRRAPWDAVDDLPIDTVEARVALLNAPLLAAHKGWLRWSIASLSGLLQADTVSIRVLDVEWDTAQRVFHLKLAATEMSAVAEERDAAARLRETMFRGLGVGVTQVSFEEELRHGLHQLQMAQEPNVQRDLALTQLQGAMERVGAATRELETALTSGSNTRSQASIRAQSAACARAAAMLYDHLSFIHAQLGGSASATVPALMASLETLR